MKSYKVRLTEAEYNLIVGHHTVMREWMVLTEAILEHRGLLPLGYDRWKTKDKMKWLRNRQGVEIKAPAGLKQDPIEVLARAEKPLPISILISRSGYKYKAVRRKLEAEPRACRLDNGDWAYRA